MSSNDRATNLAARVEILETVLADALEALSKSSPVKAIDWDAQERVENKIKQLLGLT